MGVAIVEPVEETEYAAKDPPSQSQMSSSVKERGDKT